MAVTYEIFVESFPEFQDEFDVALVTAKLATAGRRINRARWGDLADDGQMYLAASMLANSPLAQQARLDAKNDIYIEEYNRMLRSLGPCVMTT